MNKSLVVRVFCIHAWLKMQQLDYRYIYLKIQNTNIQITFVCADSMQPEFSLRDISRTEKGRYFCKVLSRIWLMYIDPWWLYEGNENFNIELFFTYCRSKFWGEDSDR